MTSANQPGVGSPEDRLAAIAGACGGAARGSGSNIVCRCPAHDDRNPSLSIRLGDDDRVLLHCHAGCRVEDVVAAIGLTMADLSGDVSRARQTSAQPASTTITWATLPSAVCALEKRLHATVDGVHEYDDPAGDTRFAVVRLRTANDKTFRPLHLMDGRWRLGDPTGLLPLYRGSLLADTEEVLVVEGERCADVAADLGFSATTSAHGSKSAPRTDWTPIAGKKVVIWPDADPAGELYARDVACILRDINERADIRVIRIPDLAVGEDIVDWRQRMRDAGLTDDDVSERLAALMEEAEPWPEPNSTYSTYIAGRSESLDSWPRPQPITKLTTPPPFPIDEAFPPSCARLREFIEAVAEAYQVPTDLPAMLALAAFGLALSRTVEVSPLPDWREPLAIYVLVLLPSGERKSPVFSRMIGPIREWQRQLAMSMELGIAAAENDIHVVREQINAQRKAAARKNVANDSEMRDLVAKLAKLEAERPRPPSLIASEATTEAIGDLLVENDERGMLAAPEGDALDVMLGRYSHGRPNFGLWLSGHGGDGIEVRRKGRETLSLVRPALTVALAVQDDAITDLMSSRAAAGRGLLGRFFFSRPASKLGYRDLRPAAVPTSASDWYGARLHQLLDRPVPDEPALLRFGPEADKLFLAFQQRVETELRPGGAFDDHRSWGAKLAGAIARIAGVLHGIGHPDPQNVTIDEDTMRAALAWAPYLEAHERHVAEIAGVHEAAIIAERILAWLRREQRTKFSRSEAFNGVRGSLVEKATDIDDSLALLEELGWIRQGAPGPERRGPGRPASPRYDVSPWLRDSERGTAPQNTHNTQYSASSDGTGGEVPNGHA